MNSEADFIAALEASPGDALLLGAFADWPEALGLIGDPAAAHLIRALKKDESARVRREAAESLGRLKAKDESVLVALREALGDEDKGFEAAAAALKKLGGKK